MAERFISINPDDMEVGKFYSVYSNKDNATLLIKKEIQDDINADVATIKTTQDGILLDVTNLKSDILTLQTQAEGINPLPIGQCWVSPNGSDSNNGGINKPFKTIQKALNELFGLINVLPGGYNENLTIPIGYGQYGPVIAGTGTIESPKTELLGQITIPQNVSRVRIKNFNIHGQNGSTITDNGSDGRHVLENCTIDHNTLGSDVITVVNGKNWWNIEGSAVIGNIYLSGTPSSNTTFNLINCPNDFSCKPIVNSGYIFTAYNVGKIGCITHNGGHVYCTNIGAWNPLNSKIINSTSANPLDVIGIGYSNFSSDGINYGTISTTGATVLKNYNTDSLYQDVCLSAISTVANTLITTTAQTLIAGTKKVERNISYNITNGELTFNKTGSYNITMVIKVDCTEWNKKVETWIEKYNTSNSTWEIVADTGMQRFFQTDQETEINYHFSSYFTAGEKYRLRAVSDSDTTISTKTYTLTNNTKMPAIRISVYQ